MSRSGYSDDCEYLELWRANVDRSIRGKRGQQLLSDLIQALDEMPEKRLIPHELKQGGEVCALGALGVKRGLAMDDVDPEEPDQVGKVFRIAPILAQEIVYVNDERFYRDTPEERWLHMREWAEKSLKAGASCL